MAVAARTSPTSPIEAEVHRIRALLDHQKFEAARSAAEALLAQVPENRDVLYMLAVSQRLLQRIPDALATLARLEKVQPNYSRLFQERGHCYVALRSAEPAIEAFLRAVNLNPALPASWKVLKSLFRMTRQPQNEAMASRHLETLAGLPVEVVTASSMFSDGDIFEAERLIRQFLLTHGNQIEAMRLLAKIGVKLEVLDDAELLLESVLLLAPDYKAARYDYAYVLMERHKHAKAIEELDKLLATDPQDRSYRTAYATALVGLGAHDTAIRRYRELLLETPRAHDVHLSIAHALKTTGHRAEAIEFYRSAAAIRPNYGDAYWSLANLKTYAFSDEEISRMRIEEAAENTDLTDRYHLCFALGKALEDRGDYEDSFNYYSRGNALKKSQSRYRPEFIERIAQLQASVCTKEFFEARRGVGCQSAAPIFIVGLPRSGSTLLEQILASHSQVEGTLELPEIPRLSQELQGRESSDANPRYPAILRDLTAPDFERFGEKYLAETRIYRTGKPRFIDKMPNNFRHIGLIHLTLPNAKIIDARREPLACCFSNFKQLFAKGQEFTYSFEDIGRYYRSYIELMRHWDAVLPGKILRVQHEDVVDDLEGNVRRILEFCDLPFEPQCVEFYKTERSVRTASSEQVRQPIFKDGLDQWRHFDPWLGPLKEALGDLANS
jgi:tetratricopeptide (TPR) repeat protein